jgi:hypothetical protein
MDRPRNQGLSTPPREVSLPALDSHDTLADLLAALPPSLADAFPESIAFLADNAQYQKGLLAQARHAHARKQLILQAAAALVPTSPTSIIGFGMLLGSTFPSRPQVSGAQADLDKIAQQVADYIAGHVPPPCRQAPPPITGLPELIQVFLGKGVVTILEGRDQLANPALSSAQFAFQCSLLAQTIAAYQSVYTFAPVASGAHLTRIFGSHGVSNLASNILSALIQDPQSSYAAPHLEALADLAAQVREEDLRRNLAMAMAQASPERAQEALNLLRRSPRRAPLG